MESLNLDSTSHIRQDGVMSIDQAVAPLHLMLRLFGFMCEWKKKETYKSIPSVVYNALVVTFFISLFIYSFNAYEFGMFFGPVLVLNVMSHIMTTWYLVALWTTRNISFGWNMVQTLWKKYSETYNPDNDVIFKKMRKLSVGVIVLGAVYSFFFVIGIVSERAHVGKGFLYRYTASLHYFSDDTATGETMNFILLAFVFFLGAFLFALSFGHIVIITIGLKDEFIEFSKLLNERKEDPDMLADDLEGYRQRFIQLCGIVQKADDMYCLIILYTLLTAVGGMSLCLYALLICFGTLEKRVYNVFVGVIVPGMMISLSGYVILLHFGHRLHVAVSTDMNFLLIDII